MSELFLPHEIDKKYSVHLLETVFEYYTNKTQISYKYNKHDLNIIFEGVEFVATPRSVVLSPRSEGIIVELTITPLTEGVLKVREVSLISWMSFILLLLLSFVFVVGCCDDIVRLTSYRRSLILTHSVSLTMRIH